MRDCQKNQTELQRLFEEDSDRARLPGGGRKWREELHLQKDGREFADRLAKFVIFSSRIFMRKELNACPK